MTRRAVPALKVAVSLILVSFIGHMIHGNWQQIRTEPWRLEVGWLVLSFTLAAAWYLVRPLGWKLLLHGFGHDVPYRELFRVYRKSELSRFVPGGIWQFAARIYLTRRFGVGAAACLAATMLDMTLAALAAIVPATWLAGSAATTLSPWQEATLLAFPAIACLLVVPRVFNAWAEPLARLLRQPFERLEMGAWQMIGVWAMYCLMWTLLALAMASYARALLTDVDGQQFTLIAGCYALAWVLALLTMVAPAGVGVREGILGLLLGQVLATGTALALAVAMRLWVVGMELVWLIGGQIVPQQTDSGKT